MNLPLIARASEYGEKIAIQTPEGDNISYHDLLQKSEQIASYILHDTIDLKEQRIAFLIPSGIDYVITQWGIWRSGGVAVPLCIMHPRPELEYVITNSQATIIIVHPTYEEIIRPIADDHNLRLIVTSEILYTSKNNNNNNKQLPEIDINRRALILYTSGTTGKPKGVVTTHANIQAQVTSLVTAWEWTKNDKILHVLPLHHIHGIINVLTCALWVGAECYMIPKFDPEIVWDHICKGYFTLFMAVPTIYVKLITIFEQTSNNERRTLMFEGCSKMRLMVSGSAALPVKVLKQWEKISGHFLLERYGMTEIGMALSNPLHGERKPGYVGKPLPQVDVRLVDDNGIVITSEGQSGEIQVKGPTVFLEYWENLEETKKSFQDNCWFKTGDLAIIENNNYRILGRLSVDIIKTGGYKVSALEIEEVLRTHPHIIECAVVGIPDIEWGERVCVAIIIVKEKNNTNTDVVTLESLRTWAKEYLAIYKVPSRMIVIDELPRNAMGKVTKPEVAKLFS